MDEQNKTEPENNFFREMLLVLKRNLILIIITILLVTSVGVAYAHIRQPNYTSSVEVAFNAVAGSGSSGVTHNTNAMYAYVDTIVDFADEGVVVDRANYYYSNWLDKKNEGMTLQEFFELIETHDNYQDDIVMSDSYYSEGNISVSTYNVDSNRTQLVYSLRYKDTDKVASKEKVSLLSLAYSKELKETVDGKGKYFDNMKINIKNLGYSGTKVDMSKAKIVLIFGVISVVLACVLAYVVSLFDRTVKSKEELERITGASVLALLGQEKGGIKNGNR